MSGPDSNMLTQLVNAASHGDERAAAQLLPLVYSELRSLARARLGDKAGSNTLQPTALVHEAYLRLLASTNPSWNSRAHFFGAAANAMRQILIEQARRKLAKKRGGGAHRVEAEVAAPEPGLAAEDLLTLDQALADLEQQDPRKAQIVMYRFFAGLSTADTAAVMNISPATVDREWRFARTLLYTRMQNPG